jgi:hypothetical protein
MTTRSVTVTM